MLSEKEWSVLQYLFQLRRPIHLEELATHFKCSARSIRGYIVHINDALKSPCISLHKGTYQVEDGDTIADFLQESHEIFSAPVLTSYMLYKIALEDGINLSHFVNKFQVSRTTAKNYLNKVKLQLHQYQLDLEHSGAITLLGQESQKRRLLLNLLLQLQSKSKRELQVITPLLHDFENVELTATLVNFLEDVLLTLDYTLSEHSHHVLINYMLLSLYRQKHHHPLTTIENKSFLEQSKEYQVIAPFFSSLEQNGHILFPLEEKLEVVNKIMGLHYSKNKEWEHHNWFEYDLFISRLIRRFAELSGAHVVGDFYLYESLLNHIKPAIYRMANGISNPPFDVAYIKKHSQREYQITVTLLQEFHVILNDPEEVESVEDEIALICVYFKQAVEKWKEEREKDVLLVCNYGYGSSRMVMENLRRYFQIRTLKWVPSYDLQAVAVSQFHLVISTETVDTPHVPLVEITPFFTVEDRMKLGQYLSVRELSKVQGERIMKVIENHCIIDHKEGLIRDLQEELGEMWSYTLEKEPSILDFMSEDTILLDVDCDSIQEALHCSGKLLEEQGAILSTYTHDLVTSFENYGLYMMLDEHCAIPHTKNKNNVLKTGFSFLRLKEPIAFEGHLLSMLFTFCTVNNQEHLKALVLIADVMKEEGLRQALETLETPQEILSFLAGLEKGEDLEGT